MFANHRPSSLEANPTSTDARKGGLTSVTVITISWIGTDEDIKWGGWVKDGRRNSNQASSGRAIRPTVSASARAQLLRNRPVRRTWETNTTIQPTHYLSSQIRKVDIHVYILLVLMNEAESKSVPE